MRAKTPRVLRRNRAPSSVKVVTGDVDLYRRQEELKSGGLFRYSAALLFFSEVGCSALTDREKKARIAQSGPVQRCREHQRPNKSIDQEANLGPSPERTTVYCAQHLNTGPTHLFTVHCRSPFRRRFAETQPTMTLIGHLSGPSNACQNIDT